MPSFGSGGAIVTKSENLYTGRMGVPNDAETIDVFAFETESYFFARPNH